MQVGSPLAQVGSCVLLWWLLLLPPAPDAAVGSTLFQGRWPQRAGAVARGLLCAGAKARRLRSAGAAGGRLQRAGAGVRVRGPALTSPCSGHRGMKLESARTQHGRSLAPARRVCEVCEGLRPMAADEAWRPMAKLE
eukprot:16434762-Heterocapsa_arctica.AAC.2